MAKSSYKQNATDPINSAIDNNAQIQFLHGSQDSLNKLTASQIISGAFYLTDDTNRLYIGKGRGSSATVEPLSDSIVKVASVSALANIKPVTGTDANGNNISSFYYAIKENVLCIYVQADGDTSAHWIQINPDTDTYINDSDLGLAVNENKDTATFTATLTQTTNAKNGASDHDATIDTTFTTTWGVKTGSGLSVSDQGDNVILLNNEHHLAVNGDSADLEKQTSAEIHIVDRDEKSVSDVTITGDSVITGTTQYYSNYITVSADSTQKIINISGQNLHAEDIETIAQTNSGGTFTTTLTRYRGDAHDNLTTSITPSITYGKDGSVSNALFSGIVEGTSDAVATLNVYTIDEVDNLIRNHLTDFDALKYVGVIDVTVTETQKGTLYSPTKVPVEHGHTYKVTKSNIITTTGLLFDGQDQLDEYNTTYGKNERFALIGDLLIAKVKEKDDSGNYLTPFVLEGWDYVPSGDDQTYVGKQLADNGRIGLGIYEKTSGKDDIEVGQIEFGQRTATLGGVEGTTDGMITISQTATSRGKGTKILLGHNTVTCTPQSLTDVEQVAANNGGTTGSEVPHDAAISTSSSSIQVVDSIVVNDQGHVTQIKSKDLKLLDTNATLKTVSLDPSTIATTSLETNETSGMLITNTVALNHAGGNTDSRTDAYRMVSNNQNLTIAMGAPSGTVPTVAFNLMWGTF